MARSNTALRLSIGAAGFLVGLALLGVLVGPRLASSFAEKRIRAELAERNLPVRIDGVRLGLQTTRVDEVCVDYPAPANGALVCVEEIAVDVRLIRAIRGDVDVRAVRVESIDVDATRERGTIPELQEALAALAPTNDEESDDAEAEGSGESERERSDATRPTLPDLPAIAVGRVRVRVAGHGLPLEGLDAAAIRVEQDAALSVHAVLAPMGVDAQVLNAMLPVDVELPASFDVELTLPDAAPPRGHIAFADPLAIADGPLRVTVERIEAQAPHTAALSGLAVELHRAPVLEAAHVEVALREWTTRLEDLYLASVAVRDATLHVPMNSEGRVELPGDPPASNAPDAESDGDAPEPDPGASNDDAEREASSPFPESWQDREWWEQLPQRIDLTDVTLVGSHETTEIVRADLREFAYSIRVINTQADVALDVALHHRGAPMGTVQVEAAWDWIHSALELDAEIEALSLDALSSLANAYDERVEVQGTLGLQTRFSQRSDRSIRAFDGTLSLDGLRVQGFRRNEDGARVAILGEPATFDPIRYTWSAMRAPDAPERRVDWQQGDLSVGEARFVVRPSLVNLRLHRRNIIDGIDLYTEIPEQPAQQVLDALPDALLGPIAEARVGGPISWRHEFPIRWVEDDEGVRRIDLDAPTINELIDDRTTLEFLPREVDVRRLNGEFEFLFRGPDDSINRTIRAPAPRLERDAATPGELDGGSGALDAVPVEEERWARLDEISYFLIAAQLYREDGRFFTNRGINWYQMRIVLEDALASGWPERGASTISMQLVKNVFLSHERSIERKLQELFLTYWMTRLVPKERILEVYLNVIEWGPDVNGVVDAAEHYFGAAPADLSLAEATWLSLITPAPRRRAPQRDMGEPPEWMMGWVHTTIDGMHDREWITAGERAKGHATRIRFVGSDGAPARTVRTAPLAAPADDILASPFAADWLNAESAQATAARTAPLLPTRDPAERTRALVERQLELRPGRSSLAARDH